MRFGAYRFHCRFENQALLPCYKGSTLRGVFGRALKAITCTKNGAECNSCSLRQNCLYTQVFETELVVENFTGKNASGPVHPFVIEPSLSPQTVYQSGESLEFNLLLFGPVNRNLPYFVYAFEKMGRIGIGRQVDGCRGNYALEKVSCGERTLYTQAGKFAECSLPEINLTYGDSGKTDTSTIPNLSVRLCTPLRIKFQNHYKADLPFHFLIRACLRRMSTLLNCYGDGEPKVDYPALVRRAEAVSIAAQDLHWFDWRRYSFRQDQAMLMGGMVGGVTYRDVPGLFLPLMEFCKKVHIGKQTAFGLGQIDIVSSSDGKRVNAIYQRGSNVGSCS
jgi:hypothetical protein